MKQEDLTLVKYVGLARMRLLNDMGIKTIKQLHETPLQKLADTRSIGKHYAKLIKNSVSDYYREKHEELPGKTASAGGRDTRRINKDFEKSIKRLYKNLNRVNENLKPRWEKKYLLLYIDFKKNFKKLKARLSSICQIKKNLSEKDKMAILEKADTLVITLKKIGKKPKKGKYRKSTAEIQSFSRFLRDNLS